MRLSAKSLFLIVAVASLSACTEIDKIKDPKEDEETSEPAPKPPESNLPVPTPDPQPEPEPEPDPTPDPSPEPDPTPDPDPTPVPPKHCVLDSVDDAVDPACLETSITLKDGTLLAGSTAGARVAIITASRKNSNQNSDKVFDHRLRFAAPTHIELPHKVTNTGKSGNGKKLYASFGNSIECAWKSKSNKEYRDPKCFEGAERNPDAEEGFSGGRAVDNDKIPHAQYVHVHVNGAGSGNNSLTTVKFVIEW